jgi:hypothetical protein
VVGSGNNNLDLRRDHGTGEILLVGASLICAGCFGFYIWSCEKQSGGSMSLTDGLIMAAFICLSAIYHRIMIKLQGKRIMAAEKVISDLRSVIRSGRDSNRDHCVICGFRGEAAELRKINGEQRELIKHLKLDKEQQMRHIEIIQGKNRELRATNEVLAKQMEGITKRLMRSKEEINA